MIYSIAKLFVKSKINSIGLLRKFVLLLLATGFHASIAFAQITVHNSFPSQLYAPILTNLSELSESLHNDTFIEPMYRYKDLSTQGYLFNKTFRMAEPFQPNGTAVVAFSGENETSLINLQGKTIFKNLGRIEPLNQQIFRYEVLAPSNSNEKAKPLLGIFDINGKIREPAKYLDIRPLKHTNWFKVQIAENTWGIVDENGDVLCEPKYEFIDIISLDNYGLETLSKSKFAKNSRYLSQIKSFYKIPFILILDNRLLASIQTPKLGRPRLQLLNHPKNTVPIKQNSLFSVSKFQEGFEMGYEIYNLLGNSIFRTPSYSDSLLESLDLDFHLIENAQVYTYQNEYLSFILPDSLDATKNVFYLIDYLGKVALKVYGIDEFTLENSWIILKQVTKETNKDDTEKNLLYHPRWGLIENPIRSTKYGNITYYLTQSPKKEIRLLSDQKKIDLPLAFSEDLNVRVFREIVLIYNTKQKWIYHIKTKKTTPIKTFYNNSQDHICYISTNNTFHIQLESQAFKAVKLKTEVPWYEGSITFFKDGILGIEYQDTTYVFNHSGDLIQHVYSMDIEAIYSNTNDGFAIHYFVNSKEKISLLGYPNDIFTDISQELSPKGSFLARDTLGNILYFPDKSTFMNSLSPNSISKPLVITRDSEFNYQIINLIEDYMDHEIDLIRPNNKLELEVIFSASKQEFWVFYKGQLILTDSFNGNFIDQCIHRPYLEYFNLQDWSHFPLLINNKRGSIYVISTQNPKKSSDKGLPLITRFPFDGGRSMKSTKEFLAERLDFSSVNTSENLFFNELLWFESDSQTLAAVWNLKENRWHFDSSTAVSYVYAYQNYEMGSLPFILVIQKTRSQQLLKTLDNRLLLSMPLNAKYTFFDEGEDLGHFLTINHNETSHTYRINKDYLIKSGSPNKEKLTENCRSILNQFGYDNYYLPIDTPFERVVLEMNQEVLIYYDSKGNLFLAE
jgi:hypothetical protein